MQLAVADVDRDHPLRPPLKQYVGEATRRGADVDAVEAGRVYSERVQPVRELLSAPRDIRRRLLDGELDVLRHRLARLVVARHEPREDERLRLCPRLGEATLDEDDVEALARHASPAPRARAASTAGAS